MKIPRILIAEDDPSLSKLYYAALKSRNYNIKLAHDGLEALEVIKDFEPHIILLDIMMPGIHGLHVLEVLKSTPKAKDTKVIIISALDDQKTIQKAQRLGAWCYLTKSNCSIGHILEKVKEAMFS